VPTGSVVLIGHSMGGMTILALADSHPELFGRRVTAVGLIGTSTGKVAALSLGVPAGLAKLSDPVVAFALRGAQSRATFVERGRARVTDVAWSFVRRLAFGPDVDPALVEFITQMIGATPVDVIAEFYPALMSHEKFAALKVLVDLPVTIVCGADDLITPVEHSQAIADELPHAELVVVPDTGHQVHMERPDLVNPALLRLVERA
jgi:pimeloyl-ACP methyl ester carboxylesterase